MSNTDNLDDIDLSAWEAPPAPPGIADAVIDRMGASDIAVSVPLDPRMPLRRRAMLILGVAASVLVVVIGLLALIRASRPAGPSNGAVIADRARSLALDGVSATLDPGADVRWKRDSKGLHVEQRAGTAAWRVDGDDKLVIDAKLASIEAAGASLRVEVQMNSMDTKIVGASAATAAVVALVTVVVYEGRVKVHDHDQVVVVQPGSTYQVQPPRTPDLVGAVPRLLDPDRPTSADVRIPAGESATFHARYEEGLRLEIDGFAQCPQGFALEVDGQTQPDRIAEIRHDATTYLVRCHNDDAIVAEGRITLMWDDGDRELPPQPSKTKNSLNADGRRYHISFEHSIPDLEITGSGSVLHVVRNGVDRTYVASRGVVLVPSAELAEGSYSLWFDKSLITTLVISQDTTAPIARLFAPGLDEVWGASVPISGVTVPGTTLQIGSTMVPVIGNAFNDEIPAPANKVLALRFVHPRRGIHYYVRRGATATVATKLPNTPDAGVLKTIMSGLAPTIEDCADGKHAGGKLVVTVRIEPSGKVGSVSPPATASDRLATCIRNAVVATKFPASTSGITFSYPFVFTGKGKTPPVTVTAGTCDSYRDKGMELINLGQHAAALEQFEAALRCKPSPELVQLAFMESCQSANAAKASHYYKRLSTAAQARFAQICIRNKVSYQQPCDADALKEKGMENINMGQHAKALQAFEASLLCKNDPYVTQLAFMESCSSGNSQKARIYYKQLTRRQQEKFEQICKRQNVPYLDDEVGYLQVRSKPAASILIDGEPTGLTTPITGQQLQLTPGKHKVTFVIGADRFTYPVVIRAGETQVLTKDLQ